MQHLLISNELQNRNIFCFYCILEVPTHGGQPIFENFNSASLLMRCLNGFNLFFQLAKLEEHSFDPSLNLLQLFVRILIGCQL